MLGDLNSTLKVFCIGLNRTGTKSFGRAMRLLGYRAATWSSLPIQLYMEKNQRALDEIVGQYDAFDDWPWPLMARYLAKKYPQAKFVLTRRESPEIWLKSIKSHARKNPMGRGIRRFVFGYDDPVKNSAEYLEFYKRFYDDIASMKEELRCSDRILDVCWDCGSGWMELCTFLDVPVPSLDFPHWNNSRAAH